MGKVSGMFLIVLSSVYPRGCEPTSSAYVYIVEIGHDTGSVRKLTYNPRHFVATTGRGGVGNPYTH
jgi:hypothetical protein